MEVRFTHWHQGSMAVERGPLVYGLDIQEDFVPFKELAGVKDYNVYAKTPWNYALQRNSKTEVTEAPIGVPFGKAAPISLGMQARSVPSWVLENGNTSDLPGKEAITGPETTVRLIPYGCTKLRISEFPWYEKGV